MANTKHVSVELLQYFKGKQDALNAATYVAKETGKSLIADTEIARLGGIETGAQVNVIESIVLDNSASANSIANKVATLGMAAYALKTDVASAVHYKGTVADWSALPTTGQQIGDMYNVTAADATHGVNAGDNVVWNGSEWDILAGIVDLSGKVDKVDGYGLSKNDFTDAFKTKLEGIEDSADVNIIETVKVDGTALTPDASKAVNIDLSGKVDKETGKSLLADTEIARLAAMSDNANKAEVSAVTFTAGTKIGTVTIDGSGTDLYAPTVACTAEKTAGTKIATVTINGVGTDIYVENDEFAAESDIDAMFAPKA